MARYINEDEFVAWVKEHWCAYCQNDNGLRCRACWIDDAIDIVEEAPEADVVPKSEVEELVQDGTRLVQENETLKDNNEHLAVMLEESKSEVERLQAEKDALIKNYAECMKDYARDIFEGIEKHLIFNTYGIATISNKTFAELKKKYIGGNDDRE